MIMIKQRKQKQNLEFLFFLGNIGSLFKGSNPLMNTAIADQILDFTSAMLPEVKRTRDDYF